MLQAGPTAVLPEVQLEPHRDFEIPDWMDASFVLVPEAAAALDRTAAVVPAATAVAADVVAAVFPARSAASFSVLRAEARLSVALQGTHRAPAKPVFSHREPEAA